jgi:cystathionine beta-lyase
MENLSNILNHLGENREEYYNSVAPPVFQSSNFCYSSVQQMREALINEMDSPFYTRGYNPTVATLRQKLAALAGAEDALVFSSGSAAIAAAVMSCIKAGDHVVCVQKPYSWTNKLLNNYLNRFGIETTMIDGREIANFEKAIHPNTRLFMIETPNSITFELQDIKAVSELAKKHDISVICDNSYATPLYQQTISMGVDLEAHSATKYLNGHSDIVAGALMGSKKRIRAIMQSEFMTLGAIISPWEAALMLRGLRTLPLRLEKSNENGQKIVAFLSNHPKVEKVYYPFSPQFEQFELAKKQMTGCGGMFTVQLKTNDVDAVERFCNHLKMFLLACSWGGYESLAFPMAALQSSLNYDQNSLAPNIIRFYAGLEDANDLIADLSAALDVV